MKPWEKLIGQTVEIKGIKCGEKVKGYIYGVSDKDIHLEIQVGKNAHRYYSAKKEDIDLVCVLKNKTKKENINITK